MSIAYTIDHEHRLVIATPVGVVTHNDFIDYQMTVWSQPDTKGYNELVDMTGATRVDFLSSGQLHDLANLSAAMDPQAAPSKLAVYVADDLQFGLARMYEAQREMAPKSNKIVHVFRDREAALQWLGASSTTPP